MLLLSRGLNIFTQNITRNSPPNICQTNKIVIYQGIILFYLLPSISYKPPHFINKAITLKNTHKTPDTAISVIAKGIICGKHKRNPPSNKPIMEPIQPPIAFFILKHLFPIIPLYNPSHISHSDRVLRVDANRVVAACLFEPIEETNIVAA